MGAKRRKRIPELVFVHDPVHGTHCAECSEALGIDLADPDVSTWRYLSEGWTGPIVCQTCKVAIPVVIDAADRT